MGGTLRGMMANQIRNTAFSIIAAAAIATAGWTLGIKALLSLERWLLEHAYLLLDHGSSLRVATTLMPLFIMATGMGCAGLGTWIGIQKRKERAERIERYRNSQESRILRLNDLEGHEA
jgi:hypothetical protein